MSSITYGTPPASAAPQALGPFPTEEMCIAAERLAEPSNKSFWTSEQRQKWDSDMAEAKASRAHYDQFTTELLRLNPKLGRYKLPSGTYFWHAAPGEQYMMGTKWGHGPCDERGLCGDIDVDRNTMSYSGNNGYNVILIGKGVPAVVDEPYTETGYFTIKQSCAPVKGWYETKQ
jgi:hypothetical protein